MLACAAEEGEGPKATPWTEHTAPTGVKYYFNSLTKESTYAKPAGFGEADALVRTEPVVLSVVVASPKKKWTEYTDATTGKKYYSDGESTTWAKPPGFFVESAAVTTTSKSKPKKVPKKKAKKEVEYANKEEAIAAFKGLLLAKDITPSMKWAEVFKTCSGDTRWSACKTLGERKQALAEYQTKRSNEEREEKRQEIKRAKDAFYRLMTDYSPKLKINPNSRFGDVRDALAKDDRFFAVEKEEAREELFYDFVEEMRKREERTRRAKRKSAMDHFVQFLKEKEHRSALSFASTWSLFKTSLDSKDLSDARFSVSSSMTDSDRQLYFADFVLELQTQEDEKRRRIRDARRRAEKAQRDAYRHFLRLQAKEGTIGTSTRWRNVEEAFAADPVFSPVRQQNHDAPREIFEDFMFDLREAYHRDKTLLNRLLEASGGMDAHGMTYDQFCDALLEAAGKGDVAAECRRVLGRETVSSALLLYNELLLRAGSSSFRRNKMDDSEDEGEIVEDGEVREECPLPSRTGKRPRLESS